MVYVLNDLLIKSDVRNRLQTNDNFDIVKSLNVKPSEETEGLVINTSDLVMTKSDNGRVTTSIISESPNLYKQTGDPMSKIPYLFETPVPKYFRENGWFKNENTWKYIIWAFSKCQTTPHKELIQGKEILLDAYEFISGRLSSSKECYLTENILRNQQKMLLNAGLLKKTTNSLTNHYTSYIWVTDRFTKNNNQQNNQPRTNHAPTVNHKSEDKKIIIKEDHHPLTPSFEKKKSDGLIDDSFLKEKNKIKIYQDIYLSQEELDECIKIKGSIEEVKNHIEKIQKSPGREYPIKNWVNAMTTWKFPNVIKKNSKNNEEISKSIVEQYENTKGWSVRYYRDSVKDDRGILYENLSSTGNSMPIFISFSDGEFEKKAYEIIKNKKMKKKGEKNEV